MTLILSAVLFVLLIFPHELGHFTVAKAVGVKVNEFSFGMGPALFKKQKGETLYSIRLIPVGGYCAMEGEDGGSDDERSFANKPAWAKLAVLFAGAAMNLLIAVLVITIINLAVGTISTSVAEVNKQGPAYEAGIREGDKILAVNGNEIKEWRDIGERISDSDKVEITYERDGECYTETMIPAEAEDGRKIVGITAGREHSFIQSVKYGFLGTGNMIKAIFESIRMLLTGEAPVSDLAGPVGIFSMVGQTREYGIMFFGFLVAFISVNLAVLNLLPLPALDGGRILFVLVRKISGGRITDEMEGSVHMVGMALLLLLFVFATWNDIGRLFS